MGCVGTQLLALVLVSAVAGAWCTPGTGTLERHARSRRTYFSFSKMQEYPAPQLRQADDQRSYFAVCACVKDQNADIREWVHYYHWLGAGIIYIYDHGSRRPALVDLEDWARSGVLQYSFFAFHNRRAKGVLFSRTAQGQAYYDCLKRARGKHTWLAFFDVDEFLVPMAQPPPQPQPAEQPSGPPTEPPVAGAVTAPGWRPNVSAILQDYEAYGGLGVNWRVFGSSGHKTRPVGVSTLEAYTRCMPDDVPSSQNVHVKMIVNVAKTKSVGPDPHQFVYVKGQHAVNEAFQRIDGPYSKPVSVERLALHHYVLKSEEEFREKTRRGSGVGNIKTAAYWDGVEALATASCTQGVAVGKACCTRTK